MRINQETDRLAPLALDAWRSDGPNTYSQAREVVGTSVEHSDLPDRLKVIAARVLDMRVARHAERNFTHFTRLNDLVSSGQVEKSDDYERLISGDASPVELIEFLHQYPVIGSLEIARLTHVGDWNSREIIDHPVRNHLDESADRVGTEYFKSEVVYKVAQMDVERNPHATVYRSRIMRSQFGGAAFVIAQGNMLLDLQSNDMPKELHDHIHDLDEKSRNPNEPNVYKIPSDTVRQFVEPVVKTASTSDAPNWAYPLVTTYRAATKHELRDRLQESR